MNDPEGDLILVCCILDFGLGSKALTIARGKGTVGETIFFGRGTVKSRLLNLLGALEMRKEILVAIANRGIEDDLYAALVEKLSLNQPNQGIAFSLPLKKYTSKGSGTVVVESYMKGGSAVAYEAIFVIVNKGLSVEVIEAAESAGSTGGTVIHGRGSGTQEKARLFNIEIEPEKDIVLILSKKDKTVAITEAIEKKLRISEPGTGIVFVLEVTRTLGLYEG